MKIALYGSIAWRHPLGLGRAIEWAAGFGWDFVDARGLSIDVPGPIAQRTNAFGYDMLGPRQIDRRARHELKQRLQDAGTPLLGIYSSSSANLPGQMGDEYRQLLTEYVQLAADLDCPWVRPINNTTATHGADPHRDHMPQEEAYDRTIVALTELARTAKDLGVGLLLENNENTVSSDAESLLRAQRDLDGACRIGLVYDPVNAYFQGHDPVEGLTMLAGEIEILHLKNVRRHQHTRWDYIPRGDYGYEWTALSDGDLNWQAIIAQAAAAGFDGPLVFEYVNPFKGMPTSYWDSLRDPEAAAQEEAEFLRQLTLLQPNNEEPHGL